MQFFSVEDAKIRKSQAHYFDGHHFFETDFCEKFNFFRKKSNLNQNELYILISVFYLEHLNCVQRTDALSICQNQKDTLSSIKKFKKSRLDLVKIGAKCMFVFMFAKCNFGYSGMWNFIFGTGNTNIIISLLSNLLRVH